MGALHEAARGGWGEIVQLLLDHGADPFTKDVAGDTPLHWAVRNQHHTAARPLMGSRKGKALVAIENDRGRTPSYYAESEAVKGLLAKYQETFLNQQDVPEGRADEVETKKSKKKKWTTTSKTRRSSVAKARPSSGKRTRPSSGKKRIMASASTPAF